MTWLLAIGGLSLGLIPLGIACFRGDEMDRLVALETASTLVALILLLLAQAMRRPVFFDLGLTQAFLSFGGGLVFVRFLERWL